MAIAVTKGTGPDGTAAPGSPGVSVLIVGCGFGGIAAAIECHRKGHRVVVFEKNSEIGGLGDTLGILQNGALPIYKWDAGKVHQRAARISCNYARHNIYNSKRKFLLSHSMKGYSAGSGYMGRRGELMGVMYQYFQKLGLEVHLNADEADAVICADGVHSKGRHFVLGKQDPPRSSGYAIYRAWFILEPSLRENPATSRIPLPGEEDTVMNFIEPNAHTLIATVKRNQGITWVLTHPDEYDRDAAHSYVPTSAQGTTQAIEDAATIAITLELAGKSQVPLALRTMEKLRYERCKIGQEMGIETRDMWLKTDWEEVKKNPEVLAQPRPNWLFTHDPQAHAYEEFETAANAVLTDCLYQPRNVPDEGSNHRATDFD
ncbi:efflux pump antibiotic resistance protein [Aspergillus udagawae]|nr:efflux pump antibiotic resistance protein [Aspergillus udagawae]